MNAIRGKPKTPQRKPSMRRALSKDELLDMLCDASEHRSARNGFTEAMEIIDITLPKAFSCNGGPTMDEARHRIVDEIYGPTLDDVEFTEAAFEKMKREIFEQGQCIDITHEAVAYCVFAVRAFFDGDDTLSWSYACDARHWAGVVTMLAKRNTMMPKPGKLLAALRHEKTYKERDDVAQYWRDKVDPKLSAQKAADKILSAGITALSHKKIAEIVSALRKAEPQR